MLVRHITERAHASRVCGDAGKGLVHFPAAWPDHHELVARQELSWQAGECLDEPRQVLSGFERTGDQHVLLVQAIALQDAFVSALRRERLVGSEAHDPCLGDRHGIAAHEVVSSGLGCSKQRRGAADGEPKRRPLDQSGAPLGREASIEGDHVEHDGDRWNAGEPNGQITVRRKVDIAFTARAPCCDDVPQRVATRDQTPFEAVAQIRARPARARVQKKLVLLIAAPDRFEQLTHVAPATRRHLCRGARVDADPHVGCSPSGAPAVRFQVRS